MCVYVCVYFSVPGMWRFVWRVSHTLCYQHLCDEHKHSLRGLGVVSQMVQCQGPWVWFRGWWAASHPVLLVLSHCTLALPRCHHSSNRVKARLISWIVTCIAPSAFIYPACWIWESMPPWPNPVILFPQQPGRNKGRDPKRRQPREPCRACPYRCESGLSWNTIGV